MNNAALSIISKMKPYGANSRLIDSGSRRRYIYSIWFDGSYIINGRAGERRYIDYTLREAVNCARLERFTGHRKRGL